MKRREQGPERGRASTRLVAATLGLSLALAGVAEAGPPAIAEEPPSREQDAPEPEPEPEPSTAGEWYARGIELGNAGAYEDAAAAFLRSYELQPTSEALFNAGLAFQTAGSPIPAIESYRRFLAEPERNEELVRAAERSIDALLREVGVLKGIRYAPARPPAELYVAGQRRELDELPLLLEPGPVVIEVVDEDGRRARETYELDAGEALIVDLRALLAPPPKPEPPKPELVDPQPDPVELEAAQLRAGRAKQLRTATWVSLGVGGGLGVTAGILGGLAVRERRAYLADTCFEYEGGVCPPGFEPGDPEGHERAYEAYTLSATISAGVSAGLLVGSLVAGLVSLRLERQPARGRTRVRLTPSINGFGLRF